MSPRSLNLHLAVLGAALLAPASTAIAQERPETPEAVTRQYGAAMRANDWVGTAELMHPDALAKFRRMFLPLVDADSTGQLCQRLFAASSASELAGLPDAELFARFFRTLVSGAPELSGMFAGADLVPIGHVLEGKDVAHVVFRMKVAADGVTLTKVQAVSLRRVGSTWRVLLSGDIEGLAAALARRTGP
ncbi:MAG: hypothetical protein ABR499_01660 [Gemmatimonadaceae bacterium]